MMKVHLIFLNLFFMLSSSLQADPPSRVVLLGGSSVLTNYLPETFTETATLQGTLDFVYGKGTSIVENWADNGEFIARFLISGK